QSATTDTSSLSLHDALPISSTRTWTTSRTSPSATPPRGPTRTASPPVTAAAASPAAPSPSRAEPPPPRTPPGRGSLLPRRPSHEVELRIRAHARGVGHAVAQPEQGGDRGDVPRVLVVQSVLVQGGEVVVVEFIGAQVDRGGEVADRPLTRRQRRRVVTDGQLVGDVRVLLDHPQDRAVRHHAEQAVVLPGDRHHDHLLLRLGEV